MRKQSFVHDTGSLLAGLPALLPGENYTTPDNLVEVKDSESRRSLDNYIHKLNVMEPDAKYVEAVRKKAKELGEELSKTDIKVLALALQLNAIIFSDDYGVLNVAQALGLEWKSVRTKGIKKTIKWVKYCPHCKKTYPVEYTKCPVCGSVLRRRVRD